MIFELLYLLFLFLKQSPDSVQSLTEILLIFRRFSCLGISLIKGFQLVLELIIFPNKSRIPIMETTEFMFHIRHTLLISLFNKNLHFHRYSFTLLFFQHGSESTCLLKYSISLTLKLRYCSELY